MASLQDAMLGNTAANTVWNDPQEIWNGVSPNGFVEVDGPDGSGYYWWYWFAPDQTILGGGASSDLAIIVGKTDMVIAGVPLVDETSWQSGPVIWS
jgi:hypothetical protein